MVAVAYRGPRHCKAGQQEQGLGGHDGLSTLVRLVVPDYSTGNVVPWQAIQAVMASEGSGLIL